MKKAILICIFIILLASFAYAKDKGVTVTWQQILPTPNDMGGWVIRYGNVPGGPYPYADTVPFVNEQTIYSYEIKVKLKKRENWYFIVYSFDQEGNYSAPSPQVAIEINPGGSEDTTPPGVPSNPNVTVK